MAWLSVVAPAVATVIAAGLAGLVNRRNRRRTGQVEQTIRAQSETIETLRGEVRWLRALVEAQGMELGRLRRRR